MTAVLWGPMSINFKDKSSDALWVEFLSENLQIPLRPSLCVSVRFPWTSRWQRPEAPQPLVEGMLSGLVGWVTAGAAVTNHVFQSFQCVSGMEERIV